MSNPEIVRATTTTTACANIFRNDLYLLEVTRFPEKPGH